MNHCCGIDKGAEMDDEMLVTASQVADFEEHLVMKQQVSCHA